MPVTDWVKWHERYDSPSMATREHIAAIDHHISAALDRAVPYTRLLSICAGQGAELLHTLATHSKGPTMEAHLIEAHPQNAQRALDRARRLQLKQVHVHVQDAGSMRAYQGISPASILLLSGVFSNIPHVHISETIAHLAKLSTKGAAVTWTCHQEIPGLIQGILRNFEENHFRLHESQALTTNVFVATHIHEKESGSLDLNSRMFNFVGREHLSTSAS